MVQDLGAVYESIIENLLRGEKTRALQEIGTVPTWQTPTESRRASRTVPIPIQLMVFRRDHFVCRYCGRRTIVPPVLRLLSILLGGVFPYHPHGKMTKCHLAFWRDLTSCDHLVPFARLGASDEPNLITACYMCNSIKQNWTIEELRWELRPIQTAEHWDGLSGQFPELLSYCQMQCPAARIRYFREWLRALRVGSMATA